MLFLPTPIDLVDLWRGKLTFRRLKLLIAHLPPGSPLHEVQVKAQLQRQADHLTARAAAYKR